MKKTKIICSIGPSTQNWENFKGLVEAGMNVARINFSHATIEERELDESLIKRANEELGANIATLYDTKGPDLRTCSFENDVIASLALENEGNLVFAKWTAFIHQALPVVFNPGKHRFIGVIFSAVDINKMHAASTGSALVEYGRVFGTCKRELPIKCTEIQCMAKIRIDTAYILLVDSDYDTSTAFDVFKHTGPNLVKLSHIVNEPVLSDAGTFIGHAVLAALHPHHMESFVGFEFLGHNPGLDCFEIISY